MVELFTARYADYNPEWGVAVRISVGSPRGWRHGPLEHVRRISPYGLRHITDLDEFVRQYVNRLDQAGADAISTRLQEISDRHDGRPLVLCCFEDLTKPGQTCHRTMLAGWLTERLGAEVRELGRLSLFDGDPIDGPSGGRS